MAEPIIFTITEAGKQAALTANADSAQVKINLTQVAVGTAPHLPTGSETTLTSEVKRGSIVSGDIEVNSNTLRFTTSMSGDTKIDVYEVGLFTDDNVLFALAGSNTTPLFSLHPNITFVIGFGLSLQDVAADSVTVITDPGGALSIVIMEQHLAAPDPHPQYANDSDLTDHIENPDAHDQYLKTSDFVSDHLNHTDPHDQYVLESEHDQDMQGIATWQENHITILDENNNIQDPHPQYVTQSVFNQKINELLNIIKGLSVGGDSTVLSVLELFVVASSNGDRSTTINEQSGFVFEGYTDINNLGINTGTSGNPMYKDYATFSFQLPSEYDPALHTLIMTGGDSYSVSEDNTAVNFTVSTTISSSSTVQGGETVTTYRSNLSETLRVEIYGEGEPVIPSGTVLGTVDAAFSGATNGYTLGETIGNVAYSVVETGSLRFVLGDRFSNGSIGSVVCSYGDSSLNVEFDYPVGFDSNLHEVKGNREFTEKTDGTGIYFTLGYSSERQSPDDNYYKYSINASCHFEIVTK